jgi:hypothetical protein
VKLIFNDIGDNDRQFGHLMTQGIGVVASQGLATTATGCRLARDGLANLLSGDQRTLVQGMTRLTAAFLARFVSSAWRAAFGVDAVLRFSQ